MATAEKTGTVAEKAESKELDNEALEAAVGAYISKLVDIQRPEGYISLVGIKAGEPGPITGEQVKIATLAGSDFPSEEYIGIGPLVIKTIRGEIKAKSGDLIFFLDDGTDEEKGIIHIIPAEVAELLDLKVKPLAEKSESQTQKEKDIRDREKSERHPTPLGSPPSPRR